MKGNIMSLLGNLTVGISSIKNRAGKYINFGQAVGKAVDDGPEFLKQVDQAHREWRMALNNFNHVVDPDLIDYYIYNIEAAEKRYVYFIKLARKENIYAPEV